MAHLSSTKSSFLLAALVALCKTYLYVLSCKSLCVVTSLMILVAYFSYCRVGCLSSCNSLRQMCFYQNGKLLLLLILSFDSELVSKSMELEHRGTYGTGETRKAVRDKVMKKFMP